jgi:hypothetical protein
VADSLLVYRFCKNYLETKYGWKKPNLRHSLSKLGECGAEVFVVVQICILT